METPLKPGVGQHGRILVDWEIREYAQKYQMIEPFEDRLMKEDLL